MIKKKLSNAVILGSADLNNGVNSVENNKLNQTQDRIELDHKLDYNQITNCILSAPNGVATYSGTTITVKQGLKVLIPNGRNADGTLNNIEYTILNDISETIPSSFTVDCYIVCEPDNATYTTWESNRIFVQEEEPTNLAQLLQINAIAWYKPSTNQWQKLVKNSVQPYDWQSFKFIILGRFNFNQGAFTHFMPDQPVELVKRSDAQIQAPYITETYTNGNSWYRVWSDGWIEQGCSYMHAHNNDVVSLIKPFTRTNYSVLTSDGGGGFACGSVKRTINSFTFCTNINDTYGLIWYACGY